MEKETLDEGVKKLPKGLRNFIDRALQLIQLNDFYNAFYAKYKILDGITFHWALICWILQLEIIFPVDNVNDQYKNIKYVHQLPEKDIKECLFYLNYILGTTVHTGGQDYVKMYEKNKSRLKVYIEKAT
jgi:hypothetical protein